MIISEPLRILFYVLVGICPVWIAWASTSWDTTPRGLLMPTLSSVLTACTIILARTKSKFMSEEPPPVQPPAPPNENLPPAAP